MPSVTPPGASHDHEKPCRDLATGIEPLQAARVAAFGEFVDDVGTGAYPAAEHIVPIDDTEYAAFLAAIADNP